MFPFSLLQSLSLSYCRGSRRQENHVDDVDVGRGTKAKKTLFFAQKTSDDVSLDNIFLFSSSFLEFLSFSRRKKFWIVIAQIKAET